MHMKKYLEYLTLDFTIQQLALWGSIVGSLMLALHITISGWAFFPYIIGNVASIYCLKKSNAPKVIEYQCYWFLVINFIGIWRWLL
jgi:hypothetical protein